ncbi:MAG TPA: HAMP domain-containing protein, partial [Bryobacteraceae bacterium]|nr:HAMP domain-containing protein [Bryobacteraceae bacterium]
MTGRIFLKLIIGVFCLLLLALVTVNYFAPQVGILVGTALAFLVASVVAAFVARRISHRFAAVMAHAGELARGNFRARLPLTGGSEFAQLARTLN